MDHIHTPKVEGVKLLDRLNPRNSPVGTLYLTTSHLIFIEAQAKKEVWVLHMLMSQIDKPLLTTSGRYINIANLAFSHSLWRLISNIYIFLYFFFMQSIENSV